MPSACELIRCGGLDVVAYAQQIVNVERRKASTLQRPRRGRDWKEPSPPRIGGHSLALPATPPFPCETKLFEKLLGRPKWIAAATKLTY